MYEYPDLNSINAMDRELFEALKHDPLLHACYKNYSVHYNPKPFDYKKFYVYLSYMALSIHQRHIKMLVTNAKRSINPPIVVQLGNNVYSKRIINELIKKNHRSYWQKLWDAVLGR